MLVSVVWGTIPQNPTISHADYVIMTTNAILENSQELEHFANLKRYQGYHVLIITEDEFDPEPAKNYNGRSEKMRQWLKDNYQALEIEYLLLIGDPDPDDPVNPQDSIGNLPMKWCVPKTHIWAEQDVPTDYYYADLSGNWDMDGDGIFGEMKPYDNPLSPEPGTVNSDYFSVFWAGSLNVDITGNYLFEIYCDDQVRLTIDGERIIDYTGYTNPQPLTNKQNSTHLTAGNHLIQLQYQEYNGDAIISLIWQPPGADHKTILPGTNLSTYQGVSGGLTGWYYNAIYGWENSVGWTNPALERGPEIIDFFWATGDQGPNGPKPGGDIYVGRIPVYDADYSSLDHILRKTIEYQTKELINEGWRKKILLAMANHSETIPGYPLGEHIQNGIAYPNYSTFRIYDADFGVSPDLTPCSVDNVKNEWKKGYGIVVWATHGNQDLAWRIIDVSALPDLDDSKPSFTFQASCHNAYPENHHNLAFELLKHGAICTVAATRMSAHDGGDPTWPLNPQSDVNHNMAYYYTEKLAKDGYSSGKALYLTKGEYPSVLDNAQMYNLYGDPSCNLVSTTPNKPPTANAGGPYLASEGELIWFSAGASNDPEGDDLKYRWDDNGDNQWDTEWSTSPFHYHQWNDDYIGNVKVQVKDQLGFTDIYTTTVIVMNQCPLVDSGINRAFVKGGSVNFFGSFEDSGADDGPYIIFWDFGDGTNSSGSLTPTHSFDNPGYYNVTFSVTDKDGETGVALFFVGVSGDKIVITDNFQELENIPEFSSWRILSFLLITTMIAILYRKNLKRKV